MGFAVGRAVSLAATLVGQRAGFAYAAPTCTRVASQWAVVFSAECTQWFKQMGRTRGSEPESCTQEFTGAVMVESFPWNDAVVIVDNETPGDDISLQPEEDVVKYGSGIVIMQTSWDMNDERMWQPRTSSSAHRVYSEVEYIASDENNYLDFDLSVHFEPDNSRNNSAMRSLTAVPTAEVDETDVEEFIEEVFTVPSLAEDESGEGTMYHPTYVYSYEQESYDFSYGFELEDLDSYSFEFVDTASEAGMGSSMYSSSFSYSFNHGDYSYSLEGGRESERVPPNAVQSVTSMDIYVCTDEENNLAELRFNCNPHNNGTAQCFDEAGGANVEALEIHGMDMICDKVCLDGQAGGLWCDIFGLNGCRLCTDDCTRICDGDLACSSCILCDGPPAAPSPPVTPAPSASNGSGGLVTMSPTFSPSAAPSPSPSSGTDGPLAFETAMPTPLETASPTAENGSGGLPLGSMAPTPTGYETPSPTEEDGSRGLPLGSSASTSTEYATPSPAAATFAPTGTDGAHGLETAMPTVPEITALLSAAPSAAPSNAAAMTTQPSFSDRSELPLTTATPITVTIAPSGTDEPRGSQTAIPTAHETPSPTNTQDGSSSRTPGPTGYETPSPTTTDRGLPSAYPTTGSRGGSEFETASPSPGSTWYDTPSPTSTDRGFELETASPTSGSRGGIPMMSAAPTSGFSECTPGDAESCYDQLAPFMRGRLEGLKRGLTCEESCIVRGGLWCNALGLNGCRFCATSCDNFCSGQGLPDDCDCFEC